MTDDEKRAAKIEESILKGLDMLFGEQLEKMDQEKKDKITEAFRNYVLTHYEKIGCCVVRRYAHECVVFCMVNDLEWQDDAELIFAPNGNLRYGCGGAMPQPV